MPHLLTSCFIRALMQGMGTWMLCVSLAAYAETPPANNTLPSNGQVVAGSASIATDNSHANAPVLNVNQASQRAVVNWDKFDVGGCPVICVNVG